jgi:hypothetical protein
VEVLPLFSGGPRATPRISPYISAKHEQIQANEGSNESYASYLSFWIPFVKLGVELVKSLSLENCAFENEKSG